ncbi:MAG: chemotaxis protein [Eubacterium sp.]|nr:chemotaxis protein [Eubacterium sp.]
MASKQSEATRRYEAKAGWISRTYKLKRDVVDEFKATCEAVGVSQASQLMAMMEDFIKKNKDDTQ